MIQAGVVPLLVQLIRESACDTKVFTGSKPSRDTKLGIRLTGQDRVWIESLTGGPLDFLKVGDVLLKVNDQPVTSHEQGIKLLREAVGKISIELYRPDDQRIHVPCIAMLNIILEEEEECREAIVHSSGIDALRCVVKNGDQHATQNALAILKKLTTGEIL